MPLPKSEFIIPVLSICSINLYNCLDYIYLQTYIRLSEEESSKGNIKPFLTAQSLTWLSRWAVPILWVSKLAAPLQNSFLFTSGSLLRGFISLLYSFPFVSLCSSAVRKIPTSPVIRKGSNEWIFSNSNVNNRINCLPP